MPSGFDRVQFGDGVGELPLAFPFDSSDRRRSAHQACRSCPSRWTAANVVEFAKMRGQPRVLPVGQEIGHGAARRVPVAFPHIVGQQADGGTDGADTLVTLSVMRCASSALRAA